MRRTGILAAVLAAWAVLPRAHAWRAYNDLSWGVGQTSNNITLYTTDDGDGTPPQGTSGPLLDYDAGTNLAVTLAVAGGSWNGTSQATNQGANAAAGTDAYAVFNGIVNCTGVISDAETDLTLTFTGLDTNLTYCCVVFGNRDVAAYGASATRRMTTNLAEDCESFTNLSSTGAAKYTVTLSEDATVITNGYNTPNGYVARYANIAPGADGDFTIRLRDGGSATPPKFYANAVMIESQTETGMVVELSETGRLAPPLALLGLLGMCMLRRLKGHNKRGRRPMRWLWPALAALVLSSPGLLAQGLVSRPVGIVRVSLPACSSSLVSYPFVGFEDNVSVDDILAGQLSGAAAEERADRVIFWDAGSQQYIYCYAYCEPEPVRTEPPYPEHNADTRFFLDFATFTQCPIALEPGAAFWIENRQQVVQKAFLAGEVLLTESHATTLQPGLNLLSYPFGQVALNKTRLAADGAMGAAKPEDSDALTATQNHRTYWLLAQQGHPQDGKWLDADWVVANELLQIGRGYWFHRKQPEALVWTESSAQPSLGLWADDTLPRVTAIQARQTASGVKLVVRTSGSQGERLDIYRQGPAVGQAFDVAASWQSIAKDIQTTGCMSLEWTDVLPSLTQETPDGPSQIDTCFYVVARVDVDSDADGIPDARELFLHHTRPDASDTDGDGMNDAWELANGLNPLTADANDDADGDGLRNIEEYGRGTNPRDPESIRVLYVDATKGDDFFSGLSATIDGSQGPKRTMKAALELAVRGDILVVAEGIYPEGRVCLPAGVIMKATGHVRVQ